MPWEWVMRLSIFRHRKFKRNQIGVDPNSGFCFPFRVESSFRKILDAKDLAAGKEGKWSWTLNREGRDQGDWESSSGDVSCTLASSSLSGCKSIGSGVTGYTISVATAVSTADPETTEGS
ncbi:unnamed protein product [Cuscuta campestris]|uniref:Uncharacterized protein n=1 Tax=Cuscuta campestris TaxID=132261 RepID=A0A484L2V7_9ASTE|nr:unnamed protein product [Cuscuta campestris]